MGIPGIAITFDDYYNAPDENGALPWRGDPQVPYIGVTRGETPLYEEPFFMENGAIPPLAAYGQSIRHNHTWDAAACSRESLTFD
jgi:hypothetical protein